MSRVTTLSRRLRACVRQCNAAEEALARVRAENATLRELLEGTEQREQAVLFRLAQVCDVCEDAMSHRPTAAIEQGRAWLVAYVELPFEESGDMRHNTPAQRAQLEWVYQQVAVVVDRIRTDQGA